MSSTRPQMPARGTNRWRVAIWGTSACLLALPLVAMQFTREVDWSRGDFIVMGVLLASACGVYELATRLSDSTAYRAGAGIAVLAGFLTVWANLAVGMLGSEHNPDNLLFGGVLLVGIVGSFVARFRAPGMVRAMQATALAQAAMVVYALSMGHAHVAVPVGLFIVPWLLSAWLFGKASRTGAA